MLHPSYLELMNAVNANAETTDGKPVVTSRYSIVVAAAQRARQLIAIAHPEQRDELTADAKKMGLI